MEQMVLDVGLKEGLFALLFVWLLFRQIKQSEEREEKLYTFLHEMRVEFSKLVSSYENLSSDVSYIREEVETLQERDKKIQEECEREIKRKGVG